MTIADAFNEITIAQGGTPNYSGTIAAAIDALNDALAGSDQDAAQTIEGAVRLLGQHIGSGGGGGTVKCYIANGDDAEDDPAFMVSDIVAESPVQTEITTVKIGQTTYVAQVFDASVGGIYAVGGLVSGGYITTNQMPLPYLEDQSQGTMLVAPIVDSILYATPIL